jgi:L-ascorbate metabolism protein UlaG (beta-lactamase superfamily)
VSDDPQDPPGVCLTWLGQAGFVLQAGRTRVVIDPFLCPSPRRAAQPPIGVEELVGADLVLCTHEHADHLDLATLQVLAATSPSTVFAGPAPIVHLLVDAGIPAERVRAARDGELLGGVCAPVHVVPAEHGVTMADAYGFGRTDPASPARFVGYVVELGGVRVYHSGDTTWWPGHERYLRALGVQVALLPINGRDAEREGRGVVGNLEPSEAVRLASQSGADLLVPMHWDMIVGNLGSPGDVVTAVQQLGLELSVLVPRRGAPFWYHPAPA